MSYIWSFLSSLFSSTSPHDMANLPEDWIQAFQSSSELSPSCSDTMANIRREISLNLPSIDQTQPIGESSQVVILRQVIEKHSGEWLSPAETVIRKRYLSKVLLLSKDIPLEERLKSLRSESLAQTMAQLKLEQEKALTNLRSQSLWEGKILSLSSFAARGALGNGLSERILGDIVWSWFFFLQATLGSLLPEGNSLSKMESQVLIHAVCHAGRELAVEWRKLADIYTPLRSSSPCPTPQRVAERAGSYLDGPSDPLLKSRWGRKSSPEGIHRELLARFNRLEREEESVEKVLLLGEEFARRRERLERDLRLNTRLSS